MNKEAIKNLGLKLSEVSDTLFIPLRARSQATWQKDGFQDDVARHIFDEFNQMLPFPNLLGPTVKTCIARARQIDNWARDIFNDANEGTLINLGAGLCTRGPRLNLSHINTYDVDFPEVQNVKKLLIGEKENYKLISSSILDESWCKEIPACTGPVVVVLEGVSMYLTKGEIAHLLNMLSSKFPGFHFMLDYIHPIISKRTYLVPSVYKTGARFKWGASTPQKILKLMPTFQLMEENSLSKEVMPGMLGLFHRRNWYALSWFHHAPSAS